MVLKPGAQTLEHCFGRIGRMQDLGPWKQKRSLPASTWTDLKPFLAAGREVAVEHLIAQALRKILDGGLIQPVCRALSARIFRRPLIPEMLHLVPWQDCKPVGLPSFCILIPASGDHGR